ncbi:hypothetical protein N7541_004739, partial [Penicillium brevicompactum]
SIDWSHTFQHELSGASAEFHYTGDPSGTIPFGPQSTLGPTNTSFPITWIPQASYSCDASSEFIQANDTRGHLQLPGPSRRSRRNHFQCLWRGCNYPGVFSRKGVLMRHIETQHVDPHSFDCHKCDRTFSRKDNMMEHIGRVHKKRG